MDMGALREFFMWCTIMNGGVLIVTSLLVVCAGDWMFGVQVRFIPITRDVFNVAVYSFLAALKLVVIVFNLVPYLALLIMG